MSSKGNSRASSIDPRKRMAAQVESWGYLPNLMLSLLFFSESGGGSTRSDRWID